MLNNNNPRLSGSGRGCPTVFCRTRFIPRAVSLLSKRRRKEVEKKRARPVGTSEWLGQIPESSLSGDHACVFELQDLNRSPSGRVGGAGAMICRTNLRELTVSDPQSYYNCPAVCSFHRRPSRNTKGSPLPVVNPGNKGSLRLIKVRKTDGRFQSAPNTEASGSCPCDFLLSLSLHICRRSSRCSTVRQPGFPHSHKRDLRYPWACPLLC